MKLRKSRSSNARQNDAQSESTIGEHVLTWIKVSINLRLLLVDQGSWSRENDRDSMLDWDEFQQFDIAPPVSDGQARHSAVAAW